MPPKFCPECGEEYVHSVTTCAPCGVTLSLVPPDGEARLELPPVSELVCVRASSVGWAMSLSEKLRAAGIAHRVQAAETDEDDGSRNRPGQNLPYGVFVLESDVEAAARIDAEHTEYQIPDMPDDYDPTAESEDCPACGTTLDASASECPDCGLAIIAAE